MSLSYSNRLTLSMIAIKLVGGMPFQSPSPYLSMPSMYSHDQGARKNAKTILSNLRASATLVFCAGVPSSFPFRIFGSILGNKEKSERGSYLCY